MPEKKQGVLWDDVIPERLIIPGREPDNPGPPVEDIVLTRVPGANYALYWAPYPRELWANKRASR